MALRALVLLDVIEHDFKTTVDAAMIEIETEAADLERFAAPFVLARVDSGIELLEDLVVACKQRAVEDFGVTKIDCRFDANCRNCTSSRAS